MHPPQVKLSEPLWFKILVTLSLSVVIAAMLPLAIRGVIQGIDIWREYKSTTTQTTKTETVNQIRYEAMTPEASFQGVNVRTNPVSTPFVMPTLAHLPETAVNLPPLSPQSNLTTNQVTAPIATPEMVEVISPTLAPEFIQACEKGKSAGRRRSPRCATGAFYYQRPTPVAEIGR